MAVKACRTSYRFEKHRCKEGGKRGGEHSEGRWQGRREGEGGMPAPEGGGGEGQ